MFEGFFFFFFSLLLFTMNMRHPFSFGAMLLLMSVVLGGVVSMVMMSWYGFVLFMIFVGGLLVLFSYVSALAPKVAMQKPKKKIILFFWMMVLLYGIFTMKSALLLGVLDGFMDSMNLGSSMSSGSGVLVTSFIWDVSIVWLVLLLFLVMVLVAYICKKHSFPLRAFEKK